MRAAVQVREAGKGAEGLHIGERHVGEAEVTGRQESRGFKARGMMMDATDTARRGVPRNSSA